VVDTAGEALEELETGVYLIKPNVGELAKLVGVESLEMEEVNRQPNKLLLRWSRSCSGFGPKGAVLVTKDAYEYVPS
jgi:6-phosphofructokinase 2